MPDPETFTCTCCGSNTIAPGLRVPEVPAHAVRLHKTKADAIAEPIGELRLVACENCGFVFNATYDPSLHKYDTNYESTQSYSPTFNAFNRELARSILAATNADGPIVEIGCGNGELLGLFLELGTRDVIGFDPAFNEDNAAFAPTPRAKVHVDTFDPAIVVDPPSAIVSKMTLEHVADPLSFLKDIAATTPLGHGTKVFIQVPNARHVFETNSIGDLLYEHCNYFTAQSLSRAFAFAGLQTLEMTQAFADQYLLSVACLADAEASPLSPATDSELSAFQTFSNDVQENARLWNLWIAEMSEKGRQFAFWGGASKAVGFLSLTGSARYFKCAIDINPRKAGSFLPATGLEIVSPESASCLEITDILVCNPIYMDEVEDIARRAGISAALHPMSATPPESPD